MGFCKRDQRLEKMGKYFSKNFKTSLTKKKFRKKLENFREKKKENFYDKKKTEKHVIENLNWKPRGGNQKWDFFLFIKKKTEIKVTFLLAKASKKNSWTFLKSKMKWKLLEISFPNFALFIEEKQKPQFPRIDWRKETLN